MTSNFARHAMTKFARLFAAASMAVGGFVVPGCQDEANHGDRVRAGTDVPLDDVRPASSSSGAIDAYGRTSSESPATVGARRGGIGRAPAVTPGSSGIGA